MSKPKNKAKIRKLTATDDVPPFDLDKEIPQIIQMNSLQIVLFLLQLNTK